MFGSAKIEWVFYALQQSEFLYEPYMLSGKAQKLRMHITGVPSIVEHEHPPVYMGLCYLRCLR